MKHETDNIPSPAPTAADEQELSGYGALAAMAERRRRVPSPDVDQAWHEFRRAMAADPSMAVRSPQAAGEERRLGRPWQLLVAAALGAAAMWVGMMLFHATPEAAETQSSELVAMTYDSSEPDITLAQGRKSQKLTGTDSLSLRGASAASPTLVSRLSSLFGAEKLQRLSTPRGMDFKVILSDGSEVWLNAESRIEFPESFQGDTRRVKLSGEAYFKVARREQQPFVVETDGMKVRVLGTEFNLRAYATDETHVSLVKGSVEVLDAEKKAVARLQPGQDAWLDQQGRCHVDNIDTYGVTQWRDGFFYFDNVELLSVLKEMARWYNFGVEFHHPSAAATKVHFTASRTAPLQEAVDDLNAILKTKISIVGNKLVVK